MRREEGRRTLHTSAMSLRCQSIDLAQNRIIVLTHCEHSRIKTGQIGKHHIPATVSRSLTAEALEPLVPAATWVMNIRRTEQDGHHQFLRKNLSR